VRRATFTVDLLGDVIPLPFRAEDGSLWGIF